VSGSSALSGAAVALGAVLLAGGWSGAHHAAKGVRQGALAGLLAGTWAAAAIALPAGIGAATPLLVAAAAAGTDRPELVLAWAHAAGVIGALLHATGALLAGTAVGALGGLAGRAVPQGAPRGLDVWLADYAQRLALGVVALAAVGFALGAPRLPRPEVVAVPAGASPWASPGAAVLLWELVVHAVAAALVASTLRGAWRLPRTAPETPVRVTVDALFVALLLAAVGWSRLTVGGPLAAGLVLLLPWGLALIALAATGRPAPPPRPPRGPVSAAQALAFAALAATVPVGLTALLLAPAMVGPIGVAPFTAAVGDPTADPPAVADVLAQATSLAGEAVPGVLGLVPVLALATWAARAAGARWLGAAGLEAR
jgi:hypothetical protein